MVRRVYDLDDLVAASRPVGSTAGGGQSTDQEANEGLTAAKDETDGTKRRKDNVMVGPDGGTSTTTNVTKSTSASSTAVKSSIVLPKKVANLDYLEVGSAVDLQGFLMSEKLYTSTQFMELDVNELVRRYVTFSKSNRGVSSSTNTSVSAGSARIYINKFRRLLRDSLGLASEGDVASRLKDAKVYRIVSYYENSTTPIEAKSYATGNEQKIHKAEELDGKGKDNIQDKVRSTRRTLRSQSATTTTVQDTPKRTLRSRSSTGSVLSQKETANIATGETKTNNSKEKVEGRRRTLRSSTGSKTDFTDLDTSLGKKRQHSSAEKKNAGETSNNSSRPGSSSEATKAISARNADKGSRTEATKAIPAARKEDKQSDTKIAGAKKKHQQTKSISNDNANKRTSVAQSVERTVRFQSPLKNTEYDKFGLSSTTKDTQIPPLEKEPPLPLIMKSTKYPETDCLCVELKDPGSLGMKIENTATNGVVISAIIPGLQAEREGLKVGDTVASAEVGGTFQELNAENDDAYKEGYTSWFDNDIIFQDFIYLAKSGVRPMVLFVRRKTEHNTSKTSSKGGAESMKRKISENGASEPTSQNMKRARVNRWLSTISNGQTETQQSSPKEPETQEQMLQQQRKLRMDIVSGFKLRMAAKELEHLLPPPIVTIIPENEEEETMTRPRGSRSDEAQKGTRTQREVRNIVRASMEEQIVQLKVEAEKLYNHSEHTDWEDGLKRLLDFKLKYGHTTVSPQACDDKVLVAFVKNAQKRRRTLLGGALKKEGEISSIQVEMEILDAVNFTWDEDDPIRSWEINFAKLKTFKEEHGHVFVPKTKSPVDEHHFLSRWLQRQRQKYREMKAHPTGQPRPSEMMTDEQAQRLTDLGVIWQANAEKTWDDHYRDLLKFRDENGHANVPQVYAPNKPLGNWVHRMRKAMSLIRRGLGEKQNTLTDERIKLLEDIGFVWIKRSAPKRDSSSSSLKADVNDTIPEATLATQKATQPQPQKKKKKASTTKAQSSSRPSSSQSNVSSSAGRESTIDSTMIPSKQETNVSTFEVHHVNDEIHQRQQGPEQHGESSNVYAVDEINHEPPPQQLEEISTSRPQDAANANSTETANSVRKEDSHPPLSENLYQLPSEPGHPMSLQEGSHPVPMPAASDSLNTAMQPSALAMLQSETAHFMHAMPPTEAAAHIQALSQVANLLPPPQLADPSAISHLAHLLPQSQPGPSKPEGREKKKRSKKNKEKRASSAENAQIPSLIGYPASTLPTQDQQTHPYYPQEQVEQYQQQESNIASIEPPPPAAPPTAKDLESLWLWGTTQLKSRYS